jgi:septum formation inhibitor MinC
MEKDFRVVDWQENSGNTIGNRAPALLLDLSPAGNSAQACHLVDEFVGHLSEVSVGALVDINAGDLLLTRGVLTKIKHQIQRSGAAIGIMYAVVPQTQQAALDEGLFVKEKPTTGWTPIRQPLPLESAKSSMATRPAPPSIPSKTAPKTLPPALSESGKIAPESFRPVDLPDFTQPKSPASKPADFLPVAPQSLEIPELSEAEVVIEDIIIEEELFLLEPDTDVNALGEGPIQEVIYADNALETLYLRQTLRSGQTIRFNGNIIIIGDVHAGSEIAAGGDIVVWGELRGVAHAGAQGNYKSEIRAMKIEALQLRIADYIARRPDRIYYHKDGAEQVISPEVARVADGEIKIFKTMLSRP